MFLTKHILQLYSEFTDVQFSKTFTSAHDISANTKPGLKLKNFKF